MNKYIENNRDFYLNKFKNIIKTETGYELQPTYSNDDKDEYSKIIKAMESHLHYNDEKCCDICIYHYNIGNLDSCDIRNKLEPNLLKNEFIPCGWNCFCNAYTPVYPLNVIKSEEEMLQFIEKTENFFNCGEEYEAYYGFEIKWNEETGEILETVREYYNRGGKFENIPDKYPCVIYFSYTDLDNESYEKDGLKWVYIGEEKEK